MDIPRPDLVRRRRLRRAIYAGLILVAAALVTLGLSRLKPAAPELDRASVWVDTVRRGDMLRQVGGLGRLVPEYVRSIPAITAGRVEQRPILVATAVKPETVLLVLSNPELEQQALGAQLQFKVTEADYANLKAQLQTQYLQQQADVATIDAKHHQAAIEADADRQLFQQGLGSKIVYEKAAAEHAGVAQSARMAHQQLAQYAHLIKAQLAAQQAKVEQARALAQLKQQQVADLKVRAGMSGVLEELDADLGQEVQPGATLAKVVDPTALWAELDIPETEAKDLLLDQKASVDTHNGIVPGHVIRIAPAPVNGTVAVDVAVDDPLPQGARPNLSVEGTVLIERLNDVLYVGRPVHAEPNSTIALFKVVDGGKEAVRVPVKIGRVSVNTVEIIAGLRPGDQVILSDTSAWDNFDRVRLR